MRPPYLTGDRLYLRAMLPEDAAHPTAWFDSPFPIATTRAETWLKETLTHAWGGQDPLPLAVVRRADEEVVGGLTVEHVNDHAGEVRFRMAPSLPAAEADALEAEALRLVVTWLRDEREQMAVVAAVAADHPTTIAAAEAVGMEPAARLREHLARPGGRADLLFYQALGRPWWVEDTRA
jgi:RimJ/RimL family protein N-acetyltransferase